MHSAVHKTNSRKLLVLGILVAAAAIAYLFVDVSFSNERLFRYAMKIRIPKLMVMLVASAAIGGATIVFQTIIHNTIVTPCLLGMNSLYTLIHTAVVFFAGSEVFSLSMRTCLCGRSVFNEYNSCFGLQLSVQKNKL